MAKRKKGNGEHMMPDGHMMSDKDMKRMKRKMGDMRHSMPMGRMRSEVYERE